MKLCDLKENIKRTTICFEWANMRVINLNVISIIRNKIDYQFRLQNRSNFTSILTGETSTESLHQFNSILYSVVFYYRPLPVMRHY